MPIYEYNGVRPRLGQRVFLAPSADLSGDIEVGDDVSFWFQTAARGDVHWIRIGEKTNVQDGSILHVSHETHPLVIGRRVVIGHNCTIHGCTLEDGALIGMGSTVLDGVTVEEEAQIGAGSVVTPGKRIPARHLALGIPARIKRPLTELELANNREISERYCRLKEEYATGLSYGSGEE